MLSATIEGIREEMERDERVVLLGQGVESGGSYKTATGLFDRFGRDRVLDTPIAEESTVGCGVGSALTGLRPIVDMLYCDFLLRAMDPIVNQAAKYRYMTGGRLHVPMVIRTSAGYGSSRGSQHSQTLEATLSHIPGLKVVMPSTPADAKGLMKAAIRDEDPVVFMDAFVLYGSKGPVPEGEHLVPLGKAEVKRPGKDVTVVAVSTMVLEALRAAETLAAEGIEIEVVDPRSLVPLDLATIVQSVRKTNRLLVVEAGARRGGVGADIVASVMDEAFDYFDCPPVRLAVPDTPMPFAASMEKFVLPNRNQVADAVRRMLAR